MRDLASEGAIFELCDALLEESLFPGGAKGEELAAEIDYLWPISPTAWA